MQNDLINCYMPIKEEAYMQHDYCDREPKVVEQRVYAAMYNKASKVVSSLL